MTVHNKIIEEKEEEKNKQLPADNPIFWFSPSL
jgi:hypothetical protein